MPSPFKLDDSKIGMKILHYLINKTRQSIQIENPKTSMHGSHQGLISNHTNVNDLIYNQTYLNTSKLINN